MFLSFVIFAFSVDILVLIVSINHGEFLFLYALSINSSALLYFFASVARSEVIGFQRADVVVLSACVGVQ
jgi:hypothetical protein